jgi:hypothetical protein
VPGQAAEPESQHRNNYRYCDVCIHGVQFRQHGTSPFYKKHRNHLLLANPIIDFSALYGATAVPARAASRHLFEKQDILADRRYIRDVASEGNEAVHKTAG